MAAIALAAAPIQGCGGDGPDSPAGPPRAGFTPAGVEPKIFGGNQDDDGHAESAVVALRIGTGMTFELCSGALIAPNVVLTARHCLTQNASSTVACDEEGRSSNGVHVVANRDPSIVGVYVGSAPSFDEAPVAGVREVIAPSGPYLCDSDIALLVLTSPIGGVTPLAVRTQSRAREGELVRSVGYGQNDKSAPIGTRFRKEGVPVLAQGKAISPSRIPLGLHEFEVGKSTCQGDSGGPAISEETGAVIGVVSRGGGCDDDFGHIYTTTGGFEPLFAAAFARSGTVADEEIATVPSGLAAREREGTVEDRFTGGGATTAHVSSCAAAPISRAASGSRGGGARGAGFSALFVVAALGIRARRRRGCEALERALS